MAKKILIIEDDAQDRKIIKLNLIKHGYKDLIFASSGEEGVAKAESEKPDLIILDINMPQMSGVEVQRILRLDPATQRIPVIFMTNLLKKIDIGGGMNRFIAKSSLSKDLVKEVKMIFGG